MPKSEERSNERQKPSAYNPTFNPHEFDKKATCPTPGCITMRDSHLPLCPHCFRLVPLEQRQQLIAGYREFRKGKKIEEYISLVESVTAKIVEQNPYHLNTANGFIVATPFSL